MPNYLNTHTMMAVEKRQAVAEIRKRMSVREPVPDDVFESSGYVKFTVAEKPSFNHMIEEVYPSTFTQQPDGSWVQGWEITELTDEQKATRFERFVSNVKDECGSRINAVANRYARENLEVWDRLGKLSQADHETYILV